MSWFYTDTAYNTETDKNHGICRVVVFCIYLQLCCGNEKPDIAVVMHFYGIATAFNK